MPLVEKPQIQIGNEVRQMNDIEFEQYQIDQENNAKQKQIDADKQALKIETLAKLGLTADEIAALLS